MYTKTPSQHFHEELFVFMLMFLIRDFKVIWSDVANDNYYHISRWFNHIVG